MNANKININSEFIVTRVNQGVKLIQPGKKLNTTVCSNLSLEKIMQLPMAVYFEDTEHRTVMCNEITVAECGFTSMKDCIGVPWFQPFRKKSVTQSIINDEKIVKNQTFEIFEEITVRKDQINIHTLSIRMPWYDEHNKTVGLFGCSIVLGKHSLSNSLAQIAGLGLLLPNQISESSNRVFPQNDCLSKRETECLNLITKGISAKEIARILNISNRTVEKHQASINRKLNCKNKYQLISLVANH